jgi:ketosteroid isomerase-like protein
VVLASISVSTALASGPVAARGPQRSSSPSSDQDIIAASNRWFAALLHNDVDTLRMLESDEFVTIQPSPRGVMVLEKSAQLETLKKAPPPSTERQRELSAIRIRHYNNTAILTATATLRGDASGAAPQAVVTEVWTNTNGRWQIVHFQPVDVPVIRAPRAGRPN